MTITGTALHALVNTTHAPVNNVLIHVPDANNGAGTDVTLNLTADEQSLSGKSITVSVAGVVDLTADVAFTKTTTDDGSGGTITEIDAAANNVSAFFGTGENTPAATGFKLDSGQLGLILTKDIPASGPAATAKYALVAAGSPSLVGGDPVTLSGTIEVKVNRTGSDLKVNGQPRTIQTPGGDVTFDFANGNDITQIGGHLTFGFAGFASLEGDYFFSKDVESLAGGGQTITFQISASHVKAFLGSNADPNNPVGVNVTEASMALLLVRSIPATGPPLPAQYALVASGSGSLVGVNGLTLSGTITAKYNNSGTDYSANPVTFNGVTINIPDGLHEFDVSDLTLSISSFVDLKGSFSFSKTVQADGTTEIDASASGVSAFLGAAPGRITPPASRSIAASSGSSSTAAPRPRPPAPTP